MKNKSVYFLDLDSTLLEMNQDLFLEEYFKLVYKKAFINGYDPKEFMEVFKLASYSMLKNDGSTTNDQIFWSIMSKSYDLDKLNKVFDDFYSNEFKELKRLVNNSGYSRSIIDKLKNKGYTLVLATSPLFPIEAVKERLSWCSLNIDDFKYITTYDKCHYTKPFKNYYLEIIEELNLDINDCCMVGNDMDDDFSFIPDEFYKILITDNLINKNNKEIKETDSFKVMTLKEFNDSI